MAVAALTVLGALHASVIALAVLLAAQRFFAGALAGRHVGGYAWEIAGLPVVDDALGLQDLLLVTHCIVATNAHTIFAANSSLGETLTIKF